MKPKAFIYPEEQKQVEFFGMQEEIDLANKLADTKQNKKHDFGCLFLSKDNSLSVNEQRSLVLYWV